MTSLIGFYITCTVHLALVHPATKKTVWQHVEAKCKVIDDRFMKVGTPDDYKHPIFVDCTEDIGWLKPTNTDGSFIVFRKESCGL